MSNRTAKKAARATEQQTPPNNPLPPGFRFAQPGEDGVLARPSGRNGSLKSDLNHVIP
jgi:hypothetical protein